MKWRSIRPVMSALVPILMTVAATTAVAPAAGQPPRPYPTQEQCFAGLPPNTVYVDICGEDARICANGSRLGFSYCIPLTAAEKASRKADVERREQDRLAAIARKADRDRQVDVETARLGGHRRKEAERIVDMRMKAQDARPTGPAEADTVDCSRKETNHWEHWPYTSMEEINRQYAALSPQQNCGSRGGSKGPLECHRRWVAAGTQMGNCGARWSCNAETKTCPRGSRVSPQ